jgi:hypothetical protein
VSSRMPLCEVLLEDLDFGARYAFSMLHLVCLEVTVSRVMIVTRKRAGGNCAYIFIRTAYNLTAKELVYYTVMHGKNRSL